MPDTTNTTTPTSPTPSSTTTTPTTETTTTVASGVGAPVGQPQTTVQPGGTITGQTPGVLTGTVAPASRDTALEQANYQKMIKSGQLSPDAKLADQLTQEKVNLFTYGVGAPVWGATDSSTPAQTDVNKSIDTINSGLADINTSKEQLKYYTDYTSQIQQARDESKATWDRMEKNIEQDYANRQTQQQTVNRLNQGAQAKSLAAMGALASGASGLSYMKAVSDNSQFQLNQLLQQKEATLIAARQAYEQNDFTKLQALIKESHDVTDQYNKVQKQYLEDQGLSIANAEAQNEFGWNIEAHAQKKMSDLAAAGVTYDKLTPDQVSEFSKDTGLSTDTIKAIFDASAKKADISNVKEIVDVLKNVPSDQKVKIGDTMYQGMKDSKITIAKQTNIDGTSTSYAVYRDEAGNLQVVPLANTNAGPSALTADQLALAGDQISTAYPDGTKGGECGAFLHNLTSDYPYGLNTLQQKMAQIDSSIGSAPGQIPPQIGDIVIMGKPGDAGTLGTNGHVAMINAIDEKTGAITLTESNWNGDGLVHNTRQINAVDPLVKGFFRPNSFNSKISAMASNTSSPAEKAGFNYLSGEKPPTSIANLVDPKTGKTYNDMWQAAITYAKTGKMPSLGLSGKGQAYNAKNAIGGIASAIAEGAGVQLADVAQEYAAASSTLKKLSAQSTGAIAMEASAKGEAKLVLQKSDEMGDQFQQPAANKFQNWLASNLYGEPKVNNLETAIYAYAREYAKAVGGGSLSASELSIAGAAAADRLINSSQSKAQLQGAIDTMNQEMDIRKNEYVKAMNEGVANEGLWNLGQFNNYIESMGSTEGSTQITPAPETKTDPSSSDALFNFNQ